MAKSGRPGAVLRSGTKDRLFGRVWWELGPERLRLSGDVLPEVVLVRTGSDAARENVPIGSRRPELLSLSVGGQSVELRPGSGRFTKRSYRIAVRADEGTLTFLPQSSGSSHLVRGTGGRVPHVLGVFERSRSGEVTCTWPTARSRSTAASPSPFDPSGPAGMTAAHMPVTEWEAAIGYALTVSFGTGAEPFLASFGSAFNRADLLFTWPF